MIDAHSHMMVFSPYKFGGTPVSVVGAGAIGSKIVVELAKLGVENISVWDFDTIEEHNIANQAFKIGDIGKMKVDALHDLVKDLTGTSIQVHKEEVKGGVPGTVIFVCVDSMEARKAIYEGVKRMPLTRLLVETRMGTSFVRIYSICPYLLAHQKKYEETLYSDEEVVEASACGLVPSIGPTSGLAASLAVWQMMKWWRIDEDLLKEPLENEVVLSLESVNLISRRFTL